MNKSYKQYIKMRILIILYNICSDFDLEYLQNLKLRNQIMNDKML